MTTTDRLAEIEARLSAANEPLPADARMDGYYIGFDRTGQPAVDAILSAVAIAGKGSHSTDGWNDDGGAWYYSAYEYLPDADCANDLIQNTATRSATEVEALRADLAALVAVVREVAALHRRDTWSDCGGCHVAWPCPTVAAVQKLGEAS